MRRYIVKEYESMGLKPFYDNWYMPFIRGGKDYADVVAVLEGNDPARPRKHGVVQVEQVFLAARDNRRGG